MSNTIRPFDPKLRDYMDGRAGAATRSIWGEVGQEHARSERQRNEADRRRITGPPLQPRRESWFPFVDKWLRSIPMRVHVILGALGGFVGFVYGVAQTGNTTDALFPYTLVGLVLGFCTLGLAALAFKAVLVALIAGAFLLFMYLLVTYVHF